MDHVNHKYNNRLGNGEIFTHQKAHTEKHIYIYTNNWTYNPHRFILKKVTQQFTSGQYNFVLRPVKVNPVS